MFGRDKQLRRALWTHVATELGGTHTFSEDVAEESINVIIDGIFVRLDTFAIRTGDVSQVYTRVVASYRFGPGPTMQVYEQGWLQTLSKTFGAQDVELGHVAFDARFIVKTEQPAVARRLWTASTMEQMLDGLTSTMVTSTPDSVTVIEPGFWDEEVKLRGGILLIAELAARDLYGRTALDALGHLIEPDGERPRSELDVGVRVVVGAEDLDDRLVMVARVDPMALDQPIEVVEGRADVSLPQAAHVFLPQVGTGTIVRDGFVWADLELDVERLRAGAGLLGALATAGHGVYR